MPLAPGLVAGHFPRIMSPPMSNWARTLQQRVSARLANGSSLEGFIHLSDSVPHRTGPETPLDLLNRAEPFFVLSGIEGGVRFLAKAQVASLLTDADPFTEYLVPEGIRLTTLTVELAQGEEITGLAPLDPHPTRPRALDFLNAAAGFFVVLRDAEACFLNRAHVTVVRPED